MSVCLCLFVFFSYWPSSVLYTLSLHDALPISPAVAGGADAGRNCVQGQPGSPPPATPVALERNSGDRKSTRLNSSHLGISYAVFCLKKKNKNSHRDCCHNNYVPHQCTPTLQLY